MTIPKVSGQDIAIAFRGKAPVIQRFRDLWNLQELGALVECPGSKQLKIWLQISGYDWEIIEECVADLASRVRSPLNPDDPWGHAIKHFSATLIRKTKHRYGQVRPPRQYREAA